MKKIILLYWLSTLYETAPAQILPWMLPPSDAYQIVEPFSGGLSVVAKVQKKETQYYFLNKQLRLSKDEYAYAYSVSQGLALVLPKNRFYQFRKGENQFIGGEYQNAFDFKGDLAAVKKEGKWGFIHRSGKEAIACKYDGVRSFQENWASGQRDGKVFIINSLGAEKGIPYARTRTFSEGLLAVESTEGNISYIDTTRREVIPIRYGRKYASDFSEGFAAISDSLPNLSYLNKMGRIVFSFKNGTAPQEWTKRELIHSFSEGLAAVKHVKVPKNIFLRWKKSARVEKWGFIDTNGRTAIPFEYEQVTRFSEGVAAVKKEGKWLYINRLGEVVRQGDFIDAKPCTEGVAWVKTKLGWGLLAITEKLEIVVSPPFQKDSTDGMIYWNAQMISHRPLLSAQWEWNGQVVKNQKFGSGTLSASLNEKLPLKQGRNILKLKVRNEKELKINESVFYYQLPAKTPIRYYAVMIANNEYVDDHWSSLSGTPEHPSSPIADADALATILLEQYQFNHIFTLRNATLEQMNALFQELSLRDDPNERILFFYAGHGDFDDLRKRAYLVPSDAQGSTRKTLFSAAQFSHQISQLKSNHFLAMIDACFGGSFILDVTDATAAAMEAAFNETMLIDGVTRGKKDPLRGGEVRPKSVKPASIASNDLETSEKLRGREIMSSGQRVEVPNVSDFIRVLLEQLKSNPDAKLAARTLFERLKAPVMAKGLVPQHGILPSAGSDGGDFIFRKNDK